MQRQSLGSPNRGIVSKDDAAVSKSEDPKRRNSSPSLFIGDDETKPERPLRCHSQPEKLIHLIPILILLCFFILYLSSHDPSAKDLAQFNGLKHPEKIIDATDIDDIGGNVDNELKGNGIFVIRSLRNLQEEIQGDANKRYHSHRKLGDF
ncbi:Pyrrolidone-carboxylate peptidase [Bienertia sinuspersici]